MEKLKVVALLVVMVCGLVGCKEDVEVHTEYVKAQPLQLYTKEVSARNYGTGKSKC